MTSQISELSKKIFLSPLFQTRFRSLQTFACQNRLNFTEINLNDKDINKLLLQSSVLALSEEIGHKQTAQKIAALLYETKSSQQIVNFAIQIISSRLGNFPVISETSQVFGDNALFKKLNSESDLNNSYVFDPEIIGSLYTEEEESRFPIKEEVSHFNVFQKEILGALATKSLVSFSAPTSFGKSFVVRHFIAKLFADNQLGRVLIIVPTKSLIDDFFEEILRLKNKLGLNFGIYTHARSVQTEEEHSIFILTQERLSFLLSKNPDFLKTFRLIYCDEAHYISRGYRGFVLRDVLYKIVSLCGIEGLDGDTKYIFSSPIIKNPDYYKKGVFPQLPTEKSFHKEIKYSPVEKNIHFIGKESKHFHYFLLKESLNGDSFEDRLEKIGTKKFPRSLQGTSSNRRTLKDIHIVLNSNLSERTILYTPNPIAAHEYALALSEQLGYGRGKDLPEINDLNKYIKDHYDDSFGLIDLLKKGIGLHYGPMPIGLRRAIVNLFEKGILDFLICTSTLLEGVNLPAKNIFVFSNKRGGVGKHSPLSFWNLVGRAGRLTYGLSGNIFCIGDKADQYKELVESPEAEIKEPEVEIVENNTKQKYVISSFLVDSERFKYAIKAKNRNDIEYLIFELLMRDDPSSLLVSFSIKENQKTKLLQTIKEQKEALSIPADLVRKNLGIDPRLQNKLFVFLKSKTLLDIEKLLEISSGNLSITADELLRVLEVTKQELMWPHESSIERIAKRLTQWLQEMPISGFIQQALKHIEASNERDLYFKRIAQAIKIIGFLDEELSFNTPKYLKCFFDIATYIARGKGLENPELYADKVESFLFSLESGISSVISRFLFEKGVSRPVAIKTNNLINDLAAIPISDDFFQREDVRKRLEDGLSKIALQELDEHLKR